MWRWTPHCSGTSAESVRLSVIRNPILIPTLYVKENLTNDNELNF